MTASIQQAASIFPRRFLFNALLPTTIFGASTAAVALGAFFSPADMLEWWNELDGVSQALVIASALATIWFLAAAVSSQWRLIVRLFEGYPVIAIFSSFKKTPGVASHQKRLAQLDSEGRSDTIYLQYPHPDDADQVMPTRLGNILRSAERYPVDRYNLDPVVFWPRLYPLLPPDFRREYEEFIMAYEFPLVVSFEAAGSGVICALAMAIAAGPPLLFATCLITGLLLARVFYVLSLSSAVEYAEQSKTAFDLYRGRLRNLWPPAADVLDEREAFESISKFVLQGGQPDWSEPRERSPTPE